MATVEWTGDVAAGHWLRELIDDPWQSTMHGVVPRRFTAYARVFHPTVRDRPVGRSWPPLPYAGHAREWDDFHRERPAIDVEPVTWAQAAGVFGTTMHATAQWQRLVAPGLAVASEDEPQDAEGWRYGEPSQGRLDTELVTRLARCLMRHTRTPATGYVALWEGWGGLVGHLGEGPSRAFLQLSDSDDPSLARHNTMLAAAVKDRFGRVFRKQTWQPGILSDEISRGPRLELPHRGHVLFSGGVSELADPEWVLHVPWRDREAEQQGFAPEAQSPSLVWPQDRAWVWVSEIDWDSTVIGGSAELVQALCADPAVEALPLPEGASLNWDSDELNR